MRIKVDEDLPRRAVELLREAGHDASNVLEQRLSGWKDDALWDVIQAEQRLLVTADKGFADARRHPPGSHMGILLLRPNEDGIRPVLQLLREVLASRDLETLAGKITVATPRGIRVRG
ncbi:MAG: DUF5615 family PIN-like protein [Armatimonadetes bacterium]|nr:DUF5615 family PIN-like protein [Armatimonadota bacterium]